jgi:hypothetical protein
MTFESQNDCICGTHTLTRQKIILPPLQNGINSVLKNLTDMLRVTYVQHHIDVLGPTYFLPGLVVPLVVF